MSRLHPQLVPTLFVLLFVALSVLALVSPPDPYTQVVWLPPSLGVAGVAAALLSYGGGFARLGWSPKLGDHLWTLAVFFAVTVLVGTFVPDATSPVVTTVGPLVGLLLGAWLGWGDGRSRLTTDETAA